MSTQAPAGTTQSECVSSELKPEVSPKLWGSEAQKKWDCVWFPYWCFIYSTGGLWPSTGDREESTTEFPTSGGWQPEKQTENNWQNPAMLSAMAEVTWEAEGAVCSEHGHRRSSTLSGTGHNLMCLWSCSYFWRFCTWLSRGIREGNVILILSPSLFVKEG